MADDNASDKTKLIFSRLTRADLKPLNDWRRAQENIPSISEAVRVLVRRGLAASLKAA